MQNQDNQKPVTAQALMDDDQINLMDILLVIAKYNRFIIMFTVISAILGVVYALRQPTIYTAKTAIMPPQVAQPMAANLLGQLGNLGLIGGGGGGGGVPFLLMLKSRTLAYQIIDRLKLQALYKAINMEAARGALAGATNITSSKDGLITIEFSDKDPKLAAIIANAYVEELNILNSRIAVTDASRKRLFFEKQIKLTNNALAEAEIALKETQKETDFGQLEAQNGALITLASVLRGQINAKEIELASMRGYATEQHPDYRKALAAIAGLRAQLLKADRTIGSNQSGGGLTAKPPIAGSDYLHKVREVKEQEAVLLAMKQQYELARMDEAKDASLIQVLESALVPEQPSKPQRGLIVIVATLIGFFISIIFSFLLNSLDYAKQNPEFVERMKLLRRYLRRGK